MKETRDILAAAQRNRDVGNRTALATVVGVEGSSYRRPGARMLVSEDAQTAGGVSGGCLERDVIEHALAVIRSGACKLITYDTTQDDDLVFGTRLGCRGLVRVFIEPITDLQLAMLNILADVSRTGEPIVCATLLDATGPSADAPPTRWTLSGDSITPGRPMTRAGGIRRALDTDAAGENEIISNQSDALERAIAEDAAWVLHDGKPACVTYELGGSAAEVFFERINTPMPLVVFGAGSDVLPMVQVAAAMGWRVTVVDPTGQPAASRDSILASGGAHIIHCRPAQVASQVRLDRHTAAIVMTHNHAHDLELLRQLLPSPVFYIGMLGPRRRTESLLDAISAEAIAPRERLHSVYAPVGLDIGADAPETIALSVAAEIQAVSRSRTGGMLRDRPGPIYPRQSGSTPSRRVIQTNEIIQGVSCPVSRS